MTSGQEEKRKNWNILIPYYFDALSDFALQEGIALSKVFGAGLVLFHCNPDDSIKKRLAEKAGHIIANHGIRTECFIPTGNQAELMFALAHKTESILIVIGHDCRSTSLGLSLRKSLRMMRKSRTPFLMVLKDFIINLSATLSIAWVIRKQKRRKSSGHRILAGFVKAGYM
ncbi:hypothetical protein DSECCO2_565780 [anaerobic digester metagenome]